MRYMKTSRLVILSSFYMCVMVAISCGSQQNADVADTQPDDKETPYASIEHSIQYTAGNLVILDGKLTMINAQGKLYDYLAGRQVTGDVTTDGAGHPTFSNVPTFTSEGPSGFGQILWKGGAVWGITHNGHAIGVLSGTGSFDLFMGCTNVKGEVTADGHGGIIYSTVPWKPKCDAWDETTSITWNVDTLWGVTRNGYALGPLMGAGKFSKTMGGAKVTGDVTADGHGRIEYSKVSNATTTEEYWDGLITWRSGAIVGPKEGGKSIGVIRGKGKVDYFALGAHVTGDVEADEKGGLVYSNIVTGTTSSDYWDGAKVWKAGAVLGLKGKGIRVISGTGRLDYFGSGAHVIGDVVADGKGVFVYSNVVNGTTTSDYWDGAKVWKAGAVLGLKGKGIGVISGVAIEEK